MAKKLDLIINNENNPEAVNMPIIPLIIGGFVEEKSQCCNVPLNYTEGGIRIPYCSKCGKRYEGSVFR